MKGAPKNVAIEKEKAVEGKRAQSHSTSIWSDEIDLQAMIFSS
jgi:hypothetical protein